MRRCQLGSSHNGAADDENFNFPSTNLHSTICLNFHPSSHPLNHHDSRRSPKCRGRIRISDRRSESPSCVSHLWPTRSQILFDQALNRSRLQGIWNFLTPRQIRDINHNTWNVTITRDILRDLPLELVCHVAKYLNPTDVFRLRKVCLE